MDTSNRITTPFHLLAISFFLIAVLISTYPMILSIQSGVATYPNLYVSRIDTLSPHPGENPVPWDMDVGIAVWVYSWNIHQLFRDPLHLFNANIYHPYSNSLATIDNHLGLALLGVPFQCIFHSPALTFNAILIISLIISAWSMFRYVYYITGDLVASLLCGWITVFLPYQYTHLATIHKVLLWSFPLSLWMIERFWETHRLRYATALGGIIVFQMISTWYLAVCLGLFIVFLVIYLMIFQFRSFFHKKLIPAALIVVLIVLPAAYFFSKPYLEISRDFPNFKRSLAQQKSYSPSDYLTAASNNILYGKIVKGFLPTGEPVKAFFPGLMLYILGIGGIILYMTRTGIRARDRMQTGWFLIVMGFLSMILAMGPFLKIEEGPIRLPFYFLFKSVPLMAALRGPQDFVLIFYTMLLCFSGLSVTVFFRSVSRKRRILLGSILAILVMAESIHSPLNIVKLPFGEEVPDCYRWAGQRKDKPVITTFYPYIKEGMVQFQLLRHYSMYYSIFHFCPIPEGHSAYVPPLILSYRNIAHKFPAQEVIQFLKTLDVEYILFDLRGIDKILRDRTIEVLSRTDGLRMIESFHNSLVYQLLP